MVMTKKTFPADPRAAAGTPYWQSAFLLPPPGYFAAWRNDKNGPATLSSAPDAAASGLHRKKDEGVRALVPQLEELVTLLAPHRHPRLIAQLRKTIALLEQS